MLDTDALSPSKKAFLRRSVATWVRLEGFRKEVNHVKNGVVSQKACHESFSLCVLSL